MKKNDLIKMLILCIVSIVYFFINDLRYKEILLCIIYLVALYHAFKYNNSINLIFLFLISFGLFNLSKIVIHICFDKNWESGYFLRYYEFNYNLQIYIVNLLYVHIFAMALGLFIFKTKNKQMGLIISKDLLLGKISCNLMNISIIPSLIKFKIEIDFLKKLGYLSLYNGDFQRANFPIWTKGWNIIFTYSFYLFIASIPSKKKYLFYSFLFLILKGFASLKGARTEFAVNIFFIVYVYYSIYKPKVSKKIIVLPIFCVFFLQIISMSRSRVQIDSTKNLDILINFFSEQGVSLLVIGINKIYLSSYPYPKIFHIFGNIIDEIPRLFKPDLFKIQTLELANISYNIQYILSFLYIPEQYLEGTGIGGNYIAELYNFGGTIAVFMGGILIIYCLTTVQNIMFTSNRFILYILIPLVLHIFISPRANLVPFIYTFRFYIYVYIVIYILKSFLNNILESEKTNV